MSVLLKLQVAKIEHLKRGQDHFWKVVLQLSDTGEPITTKTVAALSNEPHRSTISAFLQGLEGAGYLSREPGSFPAAYRIVRRQTRTPRLSRDGCQSTGQQQMWNVMRGPLARSGFTARDLVTYGSTDDLSVPIGTAKSFVQRLASAGYLVKLAPGQPGKLATWRLRPSMNSGPLPPKILRTRFVYDQNRHEVVGDVLAEEARA